MNHREPFSLGATWWVGMGRKIGSSHPPDCWRLEMAVRGAAPLLFSLLVSLALREEFEHRYQLAPFNFPADIVTIGFHSTALLEVRK